MCFDGWNREVKLNRGRQEQIWDGVVKKDMEKRGLKQECDKIEERGEVRSISLTLLTGRQVMMMIYS